MRYLLFAIVLLMPLSLTGCVKVTAGSGPQTGTAPTSTVPDEPRAIAVLLDCTASFGSFDTARLKIATELVSSLNGRDRLYVIRIRSYGFQDRDLIVDEVIPTSHRTIPIEVAQAKRRICQEVQAIQPLPNERGTDIVGAIYQAGDILAKQEGYEPWLIICSDMEQDSTREIALNLPPGTHVLCLYVSHADGQIEHYESKCDRWQRYLEDAGADSVQLLDVAGSKSLSFFSEV